MTEEEREDVGEIRPDLPEAEDAGEELMAAALDAGMEAEEDDDDLDPEEQYDDEAVKVGRKDREDDDADDEDQDDDVRVSQFDGEPMWV